MPFSLSHTLLSQYRSALQWVFTLGVVTVIAGCQTPVATPVVNTVDSNLSVAAQPDSSEKPSNLTPDLLYDILVAAIAGQRGADKQALESLSRVAYKTRDKRVIAEAFELAIKSEQFLKAEELAEFLKKAEPDNYRIDLSLADIQFKLGEASKGLSILIDLAARQDPEKLYVLHEIAGVLSRQDKDSILDQFVAQLGEHSNNLGCNMTVTILAFQLENTLQFENYVEKTLTLDPGWEAPAVLKLTYLSGIGIQETSTYAKTYLNEFPNKERFRMQYARTLIQAEAFDSALKQLNLILKSNPKSLDALYSAGVINLNNNKANIAKSFFEKYFALDEKNEQIRLYLADIEAEEEHYSKAAQYLYGISSPRFFLDAQIRLAQIFVQKDDLERGISFLEQIDTSNESERIRIILEQDFLLREENLYERSKTTLDHGLVEFPENPDLLYNRGLLAAQMELLELHEKDMRKLIEIQPENAHAYNALGYTLADKTDRLEEAMNLITKANELLPDNPFILDSMGWIHFRLGNNKQAISFLKQALTGREDPEIAAHLGEALWAIGEIEEAREIWLQGQKWEPDNTLLNDTIEKYSSAQSNYSPNFNDRILNHTRFNYSRLVRPVFDSAIQVPTLLAS